MTESATLGDTLMLGVADYARKVAAETESLVAHFIRANPGVPISEIQISYGRGSNGRDTISVQRKGMPG